MAEERVQRRLAAILAADVVGYSRLMGKDEEGTRARFNSYLDKVIKPAISEHRGRLVKTTGDGLLVEFTSVVDAVSCAADIQDGLAGRASDDPEDRHMKFRIGVHLGDVIVEDDDIHGDGVNVAARLEEIAEPDGVCISGMVHEGIRNKLAVEFDDLGERSLKNIADPVRVYGLRARNDLAASDRAASAEAGFRRPAVAVLPFENLGGDPDQEYFADGLTEDIITALSLWKSFPVIARNSTFAFKGKSPDIREVGEALGARYVIEGSVRKAVERVRVTAQLINAETGHHVWAERFDRDLADIFALQDELTGRIAATVAPELERSEHQRAAATRVRDLDAWDCVHRGTAYLYEFTPEGNARAREMFDRAIELDPQYGEAFSGIASSYIRDLQFGTAGNRQDMIRKGLEAARRGVALNSANSDTHLTMGVMFHFVPDFDAARAEFERAVQINPNSARAHISIGHNFALTGQPDDGISYLMKGLQLSPQDPRNYLFFSFVARAHLTARRYDEAIEWARKSVQWNRDSPESRVILAASLGHAGELDAARAELVLCERIQPGYTASVERWHEFKFSDDQEHFLEGLRKAGWEG